MGFCSIHQFIDGLQTISCIIIQNNGRLFSLHSSTIFFVLGISIFFPTIKHLGCNICIFLNLFALFFLVHSFFFFFFFIIRWLLQQTAYNHCPGHQHHTRGKSKLVRIYLWLGNSSCEEREDGERGY